MRYRWVAATAILAAAASTASAADSVSLTGCLPGDAVSPWADASAPFGSEQCNTYVVDLTEFQTSWGTTFGIAPIIKSSKTHPDFFGSLISAQGISRVQRLGVPFAAGQYMVWNGQGFGVNNDPDINAPGQMIDATGLVGNQFGVVFAEFATTVPGASYNGVIGGLVNYLPSDPRRLYVMRVVAGTNSCDETANLSQIAVGAVDASGNVHVRADDFGITGGCGLTNLSGNNYFRVNMAARSCDVQNVLSGDFLTGGLFDLPATEWLVRSSAVVHNPPSIVPASVTGGAPLLIGSNFNSEYVRGPAFGSITSDTSHLAPGVTDQRGNVSYTSRNCALLGSQMGMAAILGQNANGDTTIMNIWGLDTNGDVTGTLALELPALITDNCDGFENIPGVNEFNNYRSQVAFRGGNGQVALGVDQRGNLLAAACVDHPDFLGTDWPINYVAVARVDCQSGAVEWTMAGYNDGLVGKPILDGPGGNVIGQMTTLDQVTGGIPFGPSISSPMIDSVGNVYFLSAVELFSDTGSRFTNALLRAVYNPDTFCYELELMLELGDIFLGQNSQTPWLISFLSIADNNSIDSGSMWSQNISEMAHLGMDPAEIPTTADPRSLGGLVLAAEIVYDYNNDGQFIQCSGPNGDPTSPDQDYNVLLYIGATTPAETGQPGDCDGDGDVDIVDFSTFAGCFTGSGSPPPPGCDCADLDGDGDVDIVDFSTFAGHFTGSQ